MDSNNTQIVTRKLVIRPTFSEKEEWKKKVTKFTLKDLEEQFQNIKNGSKIRNQIKKLIKKKKKGENKNTQTY